MFKWLIESVSLRAEPVYAFWAICELKLLMTSVKLICLSLYKSPVWQHTFVSPSAFSRRAVVSYWRKYVHEVLVNRLGGLSLPRKSVVRLTDRPDMTLDVYRGRKTTMQQLYKSAGSVVDNMLDYQSRCHDIDPPLLRSFGWGFKPRSRLRLTSLLMER